MKRALIQFDEETYNKLRQTAFDRKQSISAVVREMVNKGLVTGKKKKYKSPRDFSFIGAGTSQQRRRAPVSEHHDDALAEIYDALRKNK
ncbi:MAG TPA: hypothetical protein VFC63_08545 [Blastocatellia bacterium]|nr:hypothetical protein [Blastocatellia bacterium]